MIRHGTPGWVVLAVAALTGVAAVPAGAALDGRASAGPAMQAAQQPLPPGPQPTGTPPEPERLEGAVNYTRVEATVACGGATAPEAFPQLAAWGFRSVINLRQATEKGANVEAEAEAVRAAGLIYLHIPLDSDNPSFEAVDRFLEAVARPEHQPVYIHCGTANRVGAVWLIKRVLQDGWPLEKALAEAEAIGLRRPATRQFALDYLASRGR
jgi:uncharacterized protein (TIGR01244 family)